MSGCSKNAKAVKEATAIRDKENAEFQQNRAEMEQTINVWRGTQYRMFSSSKATPYWEPYWDFPLKQGQ